MIAIMFRSGKLQVEVRKTRHFEKRAVPDELRMKSDSSVEVPPLNTSSCASEENKPSVGVSDNPGAQTQGAGIAYPKDTTAELPAAADTVNAIHEDIIQQTAGSHTGETNIPPLSDKGTNGVPTGEEQSPAPQVAANTAGESLVDAPASEHQPESGLAHAEEGSTNNDQQQSELSPQKASEQLPAQNASSAVVGSNVNTCSASETEQGLPPEVLVSDIQSMTGSSDTNSINEHQEINALSTVIPEPVELMSDLPEDASKSGNNVTVSADMRKKYLNSHKNREFNLLPVAVVFNAEAPLRLNEEPQFRTFELDQNHYLNRAEVALISRHPVMERLKKIIRNSGNFNCFHSAYEDLGGMVALLWTMALLSRPFRYCNGKPVEQQGFLLLDICAIQPLKAGGRCCNLNMMIVPKSIAKRNNTIIPDSQAEPAFCGESTHIARHEPYSGSNFFRKIAQCRSLWELDQFLTCSAKILNQPLMTAAEPDKTPLPYFSLLEHEFSALPAWQIFCRGLEDLKALLRDSTGMLEAAALVIFDAATMGNPGNIINQLLTAATNALRARQENEPDALQHQQNVINLINGLMKQCFKHNVVDFPAKFEESLYRSLFSQTPLPLIW
ncbi:TPA: hypothetical protein MHW04_01585 [Klebsiella pneumoniae]|nr:hypothetical protein B6J52_01340 [Klebsiella pneumoniae]PYZ50122.1 hypothetical protein DNK74_05745 [Klebsiella pneumoniae]HBX3076124.1 hypothetical protein [Klebsiella pneumoniae]